MNRPIADETRGAPWWIAALLVSGLTILPLLVPLLAVVAPGDPSVTRNDRDGDGLVDHPRRAGDLAELGAPDRLATRRRADR